MKILLGYDGSRGSDAAVTSLARMGLPAEAEAVVMTVAEIWLPSPRTYGPVCLREECSRRLEGVLAIVGRGCESLGRLFPKWRVTPEACAGSPSLAILRKADEWRPDLIVVGSHSHSVLHRAVLGSVAQKMVAEASCSVHVGREAGSRGAGREVHLVLGSDGSLGACTAADWIAARSWPAGSTVKVVTATGPFTIVPPASDWMVATSPEERQDMFTEIGHWHAQVQERLSATHLAVTSVIREGDPKRVLLSEAAECGADAIVVGFTGRSLFERIVLGSVAGAVAARADCSVDVVRRVTRNGD
jgi:nucleotide-binding universal stress UspA family protein